MSWIDGKAIGRPVASRDVTHLIRADGTLQCAARRYRGSDIVYHGDARHVLLNYRDGVLWCEACLLTVDATGDSELASALLTALAQMRQQRTVQQRVVTSWRKVLRVLSDANKVRQ